MPTKKRQLPIHLKSKEKAILELVSKSGVNKTHCVNSLKLPVNYFSSYEGTLENYNHAMTKFTEKLMKIVMDNVGYSDSNRKYLMEKLRVFDGEIQLPKIKDARTAQKALAFALEAYAKKEISDNQLQAIRSSCQIYSELSVNTDLQAKIESLENLMKEKFNED